jgi:hypothetical protein
MSEPSSGWGREFDEPIALPDGRKLITLRDAASHITALPKKEAEAPEWQAAIEALNVGGRAWRANDVRADRRDAGIQPSPRSGVQSGTQGFALGTEKAKEGPMTGGGKGWPAICDRP